MTGDVTENSAENEKNKSETISLSAYWEMLNSHDWFYHYRGNPLKWLEGHRNDLVLLGMAEQSPDHKNLYQKFYDHWKPDDPQRPVKPKPAGPR